jgi:serine/threonine-protein kinase
MTPSTTPNPDRFEPLAGFSTDQAALFRSKLVEVAFKAGEPVIRAGEPGDCLYIVRDGILEVRAPRTAAGGEARVLARLGAGSVVGEMALLNREPRNADVVALDDCALSRLAAADFDQLCARLPSLKMFLTRLVAHRLSWSGADLLARRIGNYSVIARLGEGGMSWVFRAVREQGDPHGPAREQVALKMLPHPMVMRPGFLERFREESVVMLRARHENIVTLYEAIEAYGTMFMAMEYVRGMTVREWVERNGRPAVDDVRRIARAASQALRAAHALHIIHRDIKPDNFMIREDGAVKLMDFGIAVPVTGPTVSLGGLSLTPMYGAPELFDGARGTPSSDFYSLGVMLYELLAGRTPFHADEFDVWAELHKNAEPPPLRQLRPDVPADLDAFIKAALIKDPQVRSQAIQPFLPPLHDGSVMIRALPKTPAPEAPLPGGAAKPPPDATTSPNHPTTMLETVASGPPPSAGPIAATVAARPPAAVPQPAAGAPAPARPSPVRALWLKFDGEEKPRAFLLSKALTLGREKESADICIPDATMSRRHAEIASGLDGLRLRDLGSRNGTFVNDQPVSESGLRRGDQIRLGYTVLTLEEDTPATVRFNVRPAAG